mmetsp:Transcript_61775/g.139832  ORF Transcript_61775/g.139832 Transcript_61775/m.139832 type:complete len:221 (+) Transcript_61775:176-838(+)
MSRIDPPVLLAGVSGPGSRLEVALPHARRRLPLGVSFSSLSFPGSSPSRPVLGRPRGPRAGTPRPPRAVPCRNSRARDPCHEPRPSAKGGARPPPRHPPKHRQRGLAPPLPRVPRLHRTDGGPGCSLRRPRGCAAVVPRPRRTRRRSGGTPRATRPPAECRAPRWRARPDPGRPSPAPPRPHHPPSRRLVPRPHRRRWRCGHRGLPGRRSGRGSGRPRAG